MEQSDQISKKETLVINEIPGFLFGSYLPGGREPACHATLKLCKALQAGRFELLYKVLQTSA